MSSETEKVKYPAPFLAHWATGPVPCCNIHKEQIVLLGRVMGAVVLVTINQNESLECKNCKNEAINK